MVPYEEAYGEGFEELGRRRPDTSALEQMTGWRPTRGVEEAIDDVAAFERAARPLPAPAEADRTSRSRSPRRPRTRRLG